MDRKWISILNHQLRTSVRSLAIFGSMSLALTTTGCLSGETIDPNAEGKRLVPGAPMFVVVEDTYVYGADIRYNRDLYWRFTSSQPDEEFFLVTKGTHLKLIDYRKISEMWFGKEVVEMELLDGPYRGRHVNADLFLTETWSRNVSPNLNAWILR